MLSFIYVGAIITEDDRSETEIRRRIPIVTSAL